MFDFVFLFCFFIVLSWQESQIQFQINVMTIWFLFHSWFRGKALKDLSQVLSTLVWPLLCLKTLFSAGKLLSPCRLLFSWRGDCMVNCLATHVASLRFHWFLLGLVSEDYCQEREEAWERERSCTLRSSSASLLFTFSQTVVPVGRLSSSLFLCFPLISFNQSFYLHSTVFGVTLDVFKSVEIQLMANFM